MPDKEFAIIDQYGKLMGEVSARLSVVDNCLLGKYGLPTVAAYEHCYLEFRMICELIGLASITAHGHLASSDMRNSWHADKIIAELAVSHPKFYPEPVVKVQTKSPVRVGFKARKRDDFLTRQQLMDLIPRCGTVLHRGSMKSWLKRKPIQNAFGNILSIRQKITNLLSLHRVSVLKPGHYYFCEFLPDNTVETFAVGTGESELPAK